MSESIIQSLSANVLRLGNEVRDLTKERDALKEHIRYLEIELTTETARWERAMQEVERLRASSFVTAVPCEVYEELKAEVENSSRINRELLVLCNQQASRVRNLIEAGDEMALGIEGDYNYPMPCVQAWNAAKEGKPSV